MKNRFAVFAGLLSGAVLISFAAPAMAKVDVAVHIGVPGYYVPPAPVYVRPAPVYVQAPPVYVQPHPTYIQPPPLYVERPTYYVQPRPYYPDSRYRHEWRERHYSDHRRGRHDQDRDGIPNRYDRDRDGDGVPNRYDRRPNNPYRD